MPAGNLDGSVPARARRNAALLFMASSAGGLPKSGNVSLSSPGDSGIVSLSGVDRPLAVGGPHGCSVLPF